MNSRPLISSIVLMVSAFIDTWRGRNLEAIVLMAAAAVIFSLAPWKEER
jgi:hypothetical protein